MVHPYWKQWWPIYVNYSLIYLQKEKLTSRQVQVGKKSEIYFVYFIHIYVLYKKNVQFEYNKSLITQKVDNIFNLYYVLDFDLNCMLTLLLNVQTRKVKKCDTHGDTLFD